MATREQKLDFNSEMLQPMKEQMELILNRLIGYISVANKTAEINLKITAETINHTDTNEETFEEIKWIEPILDFQITEKIKESKGTVKGKVGFDYKMGVDPNSNVVYVKKVNEQISLL
jgi:hypothetical protein